MQSEFIADLLEVARWAPSADNSQPWRFQVINDRHLIVHAFDMRERCVYDLDGHTSQTALGALLETIAIAASAHGMRAEFTRQSHSPDPRPVYVVRLASDSHLQPDPLLAHVKHRSVQRRPMSTSPLSTSQKRALENAVGSSYFVRWFEGSALRWSLAKLMFVNAKLRLTIPEAYALHRDTIDWCSRFSEERMPDQALGLDAMTLVLMRWIMASWRRVKYFNDYFAAHLIPRIELDLLPSIFCAAHFAIYARNAPGSLDERVEAGRAAQRFWLTATSLGLQLQPEMTPLIVSRYVREGIEFSAMPGAAEAAGEISKRLVGILRDVPISQVTYLGRIGSGRVPASRSLRLPVKRLMHIE